MFSVKEDVTRLFKALTAEDLILEAHQNVGLTSVGDTLTKPAFMPIQGWLLKHLQINIQMTAPEEQHYYFARRRTLRGETTKTRKSKAKIEEDDKEEAEDSQQMLVCQLIASCQLHKSSCLQTQA